MKIFNWTLPIRRFEDTKGVVRRTDNTMVKRKWTKGTNNDLHRTLTIEQREPN